VWVAPDDLECERRRVERAHLLSMAARVEAKRLTALERGDTHAAQAAADELARLWQRHRELCEAERGWDAG
jgi:hypothetical protein